MFRFESNTAVVGIGRRMYLYVQTCCRQHLIPCASVVAAINNDWYRDIITKRQMFTDD